MYDNLVKIKEFKDSLQISSYRLIDQSLSFDSSTYSSDHDNIVRISRSRSFSLMRDYIKSNNFDYFVTMTLSLDNDPYNISSAIKLFNDSIALYKKQHSRKFSKFLHSPRT